MNDQRDTSWEQALDAIHACCAEDKAAHNDKGILVWVAELREILQARSATAPIERLKVIESEVDNAAKELYQLFRQRHKHEDVVHLLKLLVNRCAPSGAAAAERTELTETVEFVTPCFINGRWEPKTVRITKTTGSIVAPALLPAAPTEEGK